jgi:hypothetical protein
MGPLRARFFRKTSCTPTFKKALKPPLLLFDLFMQSELTRMLMVLAHMNRQHVVQVGHPVCRSKDVCNGFPNETLYNGRTSHSHGFVMACPTQSER